ncbi:MAG TPA: IS3 family transposase [Bryobacteraceae bacterium]|nr:IS3 family transposase [Bryobacteraceae bacterium]
MSERPACKLLEWDSSSYRYERELDRNEKLRDALIELARQKPRYGYRGLAVLLREQGWEASTHRVHRIYKAEKLAVRRR